MKFSSACGSTRSNVNITYYLLLLLVSGTIFLSYACSSHPKGPPRKGILRENRMVALLVDLHYFEGIYTVTGGSTGYYADLSADSVDFYHEVLASHGIGREEFRKTMNYYSYNPEQFERIYNRVVDELTRRLTEAEMEEPEVPETPLSPAGVPARQSVNLWDLGQEWSFSGEETDEMVSFEIPVSGLGIYTFSAQMRIYAEDFSRNPGVDMWFWYDDGTEEGYREEFRRFNLRKDGRLRQVRVSNELTNPAVTHIRGRILDHDNPGESGERHAVVRDIRLVREDASDAAPE